VFNLKYQINFNQTKAIMEIKAAKTNTTDQIVSPEQMQAHWQGHRQLTRRVIEAFPEEQLFTFSLGGMRTFGDLAKEMIAIAGPGIKGLATGEWKKLDENIDLGNSKETLLRTWDETTKEIDRWFPQIPMDKFQQTVVAFGQYEDKSYCTLFYFIDNEIHHRGQGYVYLRALGITPPNFWER
jgi:uncharacterized damage-inducible protein DinB